MRQLAHVQTVAGHGFTKLYHMGGTASGWVGESDPRPETATGQFKTLTFGWGELYANPAATQQMLDDAEINLERWLASEVNTAFALQEGAAFLTGDGVNKPVGLMTYLTGAANASKHPFGAIKVINSGHKDTVTSVPSSTSSTTCPPPLPRARALPSTARPRANCANSRTARATTCGSPATPPGNRPPCAAFP